MKKNKKNQKRNAKMQQNNLNINNPNIAANINVVNNLNNYYQMANKVDRDTSTFLKNNHRNYPVLKEINKNAQRHPNGR